jgi:hypothetical protein
VRLLTRDETSGNFVFRFEPPEREMFSRILEMFPIQQGTLRPINEDAHAQELLEKALQEQRQKLREDADRLLRANGELAIDAEFNEFWDLKLTASEIEWVLQMLNDVRLGTWTQIGCPNPTNDMKFEGKPSDELVRGHVIMQLCASWQGILMYAAEGRD